MLETVSELDCYQLKMQIQLNHNLAKFIDEYPFQTSELVKAAHYAVGTRGHRWRPLLLFELYDLICSDSRQYDILPIACAIEYIHTASIILDDLPIMDDGLLRRGKKACHLVFGQAGTILAALWLCDIAQHLIHNFQNKNNLKIDLENELRAVKNEMSKGQVIDLEQTNLNEEQIIEKYRLKSGALYGFTASLPAHLLKLSKLAKHLSAFGNFLGIAYQCSDDVHDQVDSTEILGKDVHKDDDKSTLPNLVGIEKTIEIRDFYKFKAINELSNIPRPVDNLINLVERICV
jgi:geranylgeranyl diphosphate synthase, type II